MCVCFAEYTLSASVVYFSLMYYYKNLHNGSLGWSIGKLVSG